MQGTGSDFTLGDDRYVPIYDINNVFQEQGSLTWTRGSHNIKMGATLIRRDLNYFQNTYGLGYFRFTQSELVDLENLVQGAPDEITTPRSIIISSISASGSLRFVYVQDDWHAKSWLTLNLGLRWDHFSSHHCRPGAAFSISI